VKGRSCLLADSAGNILETGTDGHSDDEYYDRSEEDESVTTLSDGLGFGTKAEDAAGLVEEAEGLVARSAQAKKYVHEVQETHLLYKKVV
jgi:hypothetical protein